MQCGVHGPGCRSVHGLCGGKIQKYDGICSLHELRIRQVLDSERGVGREHVLGVLSQLRCACGKRRRLGLCVQFRLHTRRGGRVCGVWRWHLQGREWQRGLHELWGRQVLSSPSCDRLHRLQRRQVRSRHSFDGLHRLHRRQVLCCCGCHYKFHLRRL